jgi:hypothetical protein
MPTARRFFATPPPERTKRKERTTTQPPQPPPWTTHCFLLYFCFTACVCTSVSLRLLRDTRALRFLVLIVIVHHINFPDTLTAVLLVARRRRDHASLGGSKEKFSLRYPPLLPNSHVFIVTFLIFCLFFFATVFRMGWLKIDFFFFFCGFLAGAGRKV